MAGTARTHGSNHRQKGPVACPAPIADSPARWAAWAPPRVAAGTESCVAANNLDNGDAFRFQATPSAATVGQLRFGLNPATPVDKPRFTTNGPAW